MRKVVLLICSILVIGVQSVLADGISVISFKLLETDLTANTRGTQKLDQNGEKAALIKIVTPEKGFLFNGGSLGIVGTEEKAGEIWLYVPPRAQKLTVTHQVFGVMRDYFYPVSIQGGRTYEMLLDIGTGRYVTITTSQAKSDVTVDGEYIGQSPIYNRYLNYGRHAVTTQNGIYEGKDTIIVAITDAKKGALKTLSTQEGYKTFIVPDNVGGRFSVLTPVGLLPILLAGFDIRAMLEGARQMQQALAVRDAANPAVQYAAMRNLLYTELGKKVEVLVSYNPKFQYLGEWWKQLYGESEGKDGKGIFPASVNFTTDLHSMGQFIQDGDRIVFETVVNVKESSRSVVIGSDPQNLDQLNYLAGQHVEHCNAMAALGTKIAHIDGGVPQIGISVDRIDAATLGEIFYFFEFACGVSAYLLGVNPFNQPGVEAYKKNMFALLEKPGYEERTAELRARI